MKSTILIVESRRANKLDREAVAKQGFILNHCLTATEAFERSSHCAPDVVLVEAPMVDMSVDNFVRIFNRQFPQTVILVMVEASQSELAAEAIQAGATDYLLKPFTGEQLIATARQALNLQQPSDDLVVKSPLSRQLMQLAYRAAQTDATILVTGESGTGKERLSQYIHQSSPRSKGPFVAVNCAAIPETMIESILFGHTKGAFTGATGSQPGKFEQANGGTLMLDEISEMPLPLQAKLLRVIQEREVERLGSHEKISLDIRIIAATNKNLADLVAQGQFRQDLYYRLDVLPISSPALRERKEDITPLAEFFLKKYGTQGEYKLSAQAKYLLMAHDWPGNVRELENVIQRAVVLARGLEIQPQDLMLPVTCNKAPTISTDLNALAALAQHGMGAINSQIETSPSPQGLEDSKKQAEYQYVLDTLKQFNGHKTKTAAALGVTTRALRYKMAAMREQGIQV